jgi:hypothetical protein
MCFASDDVQSYSVPKDHPAVVPVAASAPVITSDVDASSAPIHWTLPDGWKDRGRTGLRLGNFLIPGKDNQKADVAITSFHGAVGTELGNVNRWRNEIGLPPVGQPDIASDPITVDSLQGKIYDFTGAMARTVVVSLPRNGSTWFFKLRGDSAVVVAAKPAFLEFLKSVRLSDTPSPVVTAGGAPDPHAGLGAAAPEPSGTEPKWTVPANWTATTPGPMVFKSFSIKATGTEKAIVAVSTFPGDVGGNFANVNRWRRQMGLHPITEDQLSSVTQALDITGGKALLVDLTGKDGKTSQPARMVAVIVAQGDSTWFYKLVGDESIVSTEKSSFVNFVQSVHYP